MEKEFLVALGFCLTDIVHFEIHSSISNIEHWTTIHPSIHPSILTWKMKNKTLMEMISEKFLYSNLKSEFEIENLHFQYWLFYVYVLWKQRQHKHETCHFIVMSSKINPFVMRIEWIDQHSTWISLRHLVT